MQPQRPRPRFRTAQVRRVDRLSPRMVRVTLAGDELQGFELPTPTQHVKLIIPEPGQSKPVLPDPSVPRGASVPGQPRPLMRTYTVRRYDPAAVELDIDFALHVDGPASDWAAQTKPGDVAALAGPGGRPYRPDLDVSWYFIAGDESALPAMGTLLDVLPASIEAHVLTEVQKPDEELEWHSKAQLRASWLHRVSDSAKPGTELVDAVSQIKRPAGEGRVWLACEASMMRRIRKHLVEAWQLDPSAIVTRGYWKEGEVNYPDHDYGETDGDR